MSGWQGLWQKPEIAEQWAEFPPVNEVTAMADLLEAEGRRRVLDIGCGTGRHHGIDEGGSVEPLELPVLREKWDPLFRMDRRIGNRNFHPVPFPSLLAAGSH